MCSRMYLIFCFYRILCANINIIHKSNLALSNYITLQTLFRNTYSQIIILLVLFYFRQHVQILLYDTHWLIELKNRNKKKLLKVFIGSFIIETYTATSISSTCINLLCVYSHPFCLFIF